MNDHLLPGLGGPPQSTQISVFDLVNMRIGLDQIKEPSDAIRKSIATLDQIILNFTSSLNKGN